jgi:hypothetical protein
MTLKFNRMWWLVLVCAVSVASACGGDDDDDGDDGDDDGGAAVCGDDIINGTEDCDGTVLGSNDCTTVGGDFTGGTLACADDCTFDTSACVAGGACGNGAIDDGEACDGSQFGDASCDALAGFVGGVLACTDECEIDTSACTASSQPIIATAPARRWRSPTRWSHI